MIEEIKIENEKELSLLERIKKFNSKPPCITFNIYFFRIVIIIMYCIGLILGKYFI